ncbi:MAG: hypothetical protein WCC17_16015 [Candidatus Nitrosopolaris sp.]
MSLSGWLGAVVMSRRAKLFDIISGWNLCRFSADSSPTTSVVNNREVVASIIQTEYPLGEDLFGYLKGKGFVWNMMMGNNCYRVPYRYYLPFGSSLR